MKTVPKTLYFLSCYDFNEIVSYPEENVTETVKLKIILVVKRNYSVI